MASSSLQLVGGPFSRTSCCCIHQVSGAVPTTWGGRLQPSSSVFLSSSTFLAKAPLGALKKSGARRLGLARQCQFHHSAIRAMSPPEKSLHLDESPIELRTVQIVAAPPEDQKLKLRVDIGGQDTQRAFDTLLMELAKNSPPVPGFRKSKGGKTSTVPKKVLLQLLGASRVRKFVMEEVVRSALSGFVKKENLKVKDTLRTVQSGEELYDSFEPGKEFGFDAELQMEEGAYSNGPTSPSSEEELQAAPV